MENHKRAAFVIYPHKKIEKRIIKMDSSASVIFPNLGIVIKNLPVSINLFGFEIAFYGLIIGIGVLGGMCLAFREAKITGQNVDHYVDLALFGLIFGIIGARLYYVIFEWDYYSKNLGEIINLRNGGLAIYGGIIACIITGIVVARIHKLKFFRVADTACLGLMVGQMIGRWGNFFNREAFGGNSDGLFAMAINTDDGIVNVAVPEGVRFIENTKFIQVQPTFLYESFWNLCLLVVIMLLRKHKKFEGEVFAWYIGGYGIGRFWIEGMRTDQLILKGFNVPISQVIAVLMVLIAAGICIYMRRMIKLGRIESFDGKEFYKAGKVHKAEEEKIDVEADMDSETKVKENPDTETDNTDIK